MEPIELEDINPVKKTNKPSMVPILIAAVLGSITSFGLYFVLKDSLLPDTRHDSSVAEDDDWENAPFRDSSINFRNETLPEKSPTTTEDNTDLNKTQFSRRDKSDMALPAIAPFDADEARAYQQAWADKAGVLIEGTNSIGMSFVVIPPGEYLMGSDTFADGESPAHRVKLTQPIEFGMHEVTQEQYEKVVGANPSQFKGANHPVEQVSWSQAVEFCQRLSERPEERDSGYEYRLPTEAEWEYVCRAGTTTPYSFGNEAGQLENFAFYSGNAGGQTHPVGLKPPNPWGVYDLQGNVREWCLDWHGGYTNDLTIDPDGPASGSHKVSRGGGFGSVSGSCRSSFRYVCDLEEVSRDLGFRVIRTRSATRSATRDNPQQSMAAIQTDEQSSANPDTQPLKQADSPVFSSPEIDAKALKDLVEKGPFSGRSTDARKLLVKAEGGSEQSEAAVERALKWIADRQRPDGSWDFSEIGDSPDGGVFDTCQMGATGMALMALLGAGHTHTEDGPYKTHVAEGLNYLKENSRNVPLGIDYRAPDNTGNMYVQGICVIALAEACAMTRDRRLRRFVQGGVEFIVNAQNKKTGGWRYKPGDRGDTSVLGWQITALTSAHHAGIDVPENTLAGAFSYLDRVELFDGTYTWYGYERAAKKLSTSAVGLLSRMYLGWELEENHLKKGIQLLSDNGPSQDNDYYNYYATQVMHHRGGAQWDAWNNVMREQVISRQEQNEGPSLGSWTPAADDHGSKAGRLYSTCLNVMILEAYYRHLPLYRIADL